MSTLYQFNFNLRQDEGRWLATCQTPGFVIDAKTKADAIQEALARWVRHLKTLRVYPQGKPRVDRTEPYSSSSSKQKKFGGLAIKAKFPQEVVYASVEA